MYIHFLNFVYSSITGELPLQTAYTQTYPAAMSVGAAEASAYKKKHPYEKCVTAAQAERLDSLGIGIQAKGSQQPGRFRHSPEYGMAWWETGASLLYV